VTLKRPEGYRSINKDLPAIFWNPEPFLIDHSANLEGRNPLAIDHSAMFERMNPFATDIPAHLGGLTPLAILSGREGQAV